jgi:Transposase DDE domain
VFVADRGFPSAQLFGQLGAQQTDWTVRLRLNDWVEVADVYAMVAQHLDAGRLRPGERVRATIGRGTPEQPRVSAWIVVNETLPVPPSHKRNAGTERERAARAKERARHRANKGRKSSAPSATAQRYAQTWVLFTTAPTVQAAVEQYAARMAIEQTFRDWHHGWGLRAVAASLPTAEAVRRLVGIVCLAYRLQVELGLRFSQDGQGQRRRAQWTVTDRVSYFWCGQHVIHDPGADWSGWLAAQWDQLIAPAGAVPLAIAA